MKEAQPNILVEGALAAAVRPMEKLVANVDVVRVPSYIDTNRQEKSLISQLDANLTQVEDLTHRLNFLMREVSHIIQKRSQ